MKLRRLLIILLIIIAAISLRFPEAFDAISLKLPINAMEADVEAGSPKEFNDAILAAIREVKDSMKVRIVKYNKETYDVNTALKRILNENVELGFVIGCTARVTQTRGKDYAVMELELKYLYPRENIIAMRDETEYKANEIIENIIKPGMNDYEKVLAVHDYIVLSSRYDRLNSDNNTVPQEEHEAYGVLINGIGVCDSYAKAVKLLLEKVGVECILVEGSKAGTDIKRLSDVDHAWNIVKLEGEHYHVDATWDDVSEDQDSNELMHHHFNVNDEEMRKTHTWDRSKYPVCEGTKYNYFRYNKLIANNRSEAQKMLVNAISKRNRKLHVKIADYKSTTYDIEKMIQKAAEKSSLNQGISAKWIVNEPLGIIEIEFTYVAK